MQFDHLEDEDDEFRSFLTEVMERWVVRECHRHSPPLGDTIQEDGGTESERDPRRAYAHQT